MKNPSRRIVLTYTVIAAVISLVVGASATVVHASQQQAPSSAPPVKQNTTGNPPKRRQFEPVPDMVPGATSDVFEENAPTPVSRSSMVGDWYGLDSTQMMLVTLTIGQEGVLTRLAVARRSGNAVATRIYEFKDIVVNNGQFMIGEEGSTVRLTGSAEVFWQLGTGSGTLAIDSAEGRLSADLYFFHQRRGSWLDDILTRARTYGLL